MPVTKRKHGDEGEDEPELKTKKGEEESDEDFEDDDEDEFEEEELSEYEEGGSDDSFDEFDEDSDGAYGAKKKKKASPRKAPPRRALGRSSSSTTTLTRSGSTGARAGTRSNAKLKDIWDPAAPPKEAILDHDKITERLGRNTYLKGLDYYEAGKITGLKFAGDSLTLSGGCRGQSENYKITVTFNNNTTDPDKYFTAKCACPVGGEGACKHVAAVLLQWAHDNGIDKGEWKMPAEDAAKLKKFKDDIKALNVQALKDQLKLNDQPTTGNKAELSDRVADGMLYGALPRCPKCSGGRLRFQDGWYYCPGYMEDETFQECDWAATTVSRTPWKTTA